VALPLATLFAQPTLASLAEAVAALRAQRGVQALPPIARVARGGPLAASFAQQRLWFLAQLGLGGSYHMPLGLPPRGGLAARALRRSPDALVARHEALRSVFVAIDGEPAVELLPPDRGFALVEHDLVAAPDADAQLEQWREEEAHAPFDLARGPLIRGRLVR